MKAGVLFKAGDIRYVDFDNPVCDDDSVIVKVKACGICGSDPPRILNHWKYPVPAIAGHEFSGVIWEKGKNVKGFDINERVTAAPFIPCNECHYCKSGIYSMCDNYGMIGAKTYGAFAEYVKVPAMNLVKIYDMNFEDGAMIEPLAVAAHAVIGTEPQLGDTVAVMGAGIIGQLTIDWLKIAGVTNIIAVDISDKKLEISKQLGAKFCINPLKSDLVKSIMDITGNAGVDISMECAGSKITEEQCLLITRKKGKVAYIGIAHSDVLLKENAFEGIFRKELTLKGYFNSYSAPFPGKEWAMSVNYVQSGNIVLKDLVSHKYKLSEIKEAFDMIGAKKEEYNKILIKP
ncbi:MAG: Alcohol dehydrogenase GroES domain protein [Clostridiaceae bacterium]|jgi:L-iditol 2-dehydrogenase|nr:Alcohol dehydrogenase GroES domain protein [Clostridiaceae bacterium]